MAKKPRVHSETSTPAKKRRTPFAVLTATHDDPDTSLVFDSSGELLVDSLITSAPIAFASPARASTSTVRQHRDEPVLAYLPDTQGGALVGELFAQREASKGQRLIGIDEVKMLLVDSQDKMREETSVRTRLFNAASTT